MADDKILFAKRLKEVRIRRGLSQKELANKVGLSPRSIGSYEIDARQPSLSLLVKLAQELNCSVDYLIGSTYNPIELLNNVHLSDNEKDKIHKLIDLLIKEPYKIELFDMFSQLDRDELMEIKGEVKQMLKSEKYIKKFTNNEIKQAN